MGSTRMSQVLNEPGQKSVRIEICKKISTQLGPNPWWAGLARGFQPILTALFINNKFHMNKLVNIYVLKKKTST